MQRKSFSDSGSGLHFFKVVDNEGYLSFCVTNTGCNNPAQCYFEVAYNKKSRITPHQCNSSLPGFFYGTHPDDRGKYLELLLDKGPDVLYTELTRSYLNIKNTISKE